MFPISAFHIQHQTHSTAGSAAPTGEAGEEAGVVRQLAGAAVPAVHGGLRGGLDGTHHRLAAPQKKKNQLHTPA